MNTISVISLSGSILMTMVNIVLLIRSLCKDFNDASDNDRANAILAEKKRKKEPRMSFRVGPR